ncbi:MAG: nitrogen assimilation regulatory protein [Pirellulaceae bacterium]|nr:MAG: nitrogen assimilation regulatory protein [Pirellulaceae bacterium]
MSRFLVVDDEPADVGLLTSVLEKKGHEVVSASTGRDALRLLDETHPDVVLLDILLPDENGLEIFRRMRARDSKLPVIFVTASGSASTAIEAMRLGAFDYLTKPLNLREVHQVVERALEVRRLAHAPVKIDSSPDVDSGDVIIGRSAAMQEVYKAIGLVAPQDVTVLITGESGTGKELVARAIYQYSRRADGPFLAVNCAAIPETLLESELFGHEKGAFTGADRRRIGKFEQCHKGTIFLDEVGDMPLLLQSKILRVLQEKSFERVGGNQTIQTDVRVLAATHRNLVEMVQQGRFREDLLYRLNGFTIHLPPLRERGDDLLLLIEHFRRQANRDLEKDVQGFSEETIAILKRHHWPGNVRELQNVVRQAVLKTSGPVVLPDFLPDYLRQAPAANLGNDVPYGALEGWIDAQLRTRSSHVYDEVVGTIERILVERALLHHGGDRLAALRQLGVNPATFRSTAGLELLDLESAACRADDPKPADPGTRGTGESGDASTSTDVVDDSLFKPTMTMEEIEREAIRRALRRTKGRRTEAAQLLGISVRTLQRKIKEYNLEL